MRSYAVVVLVATAALFAACDARQLAQQDALSNSNGCLATIAKCEEGACATRNVMGVARWVCLRCLANYEPVVDASGQDNILQCGELRCWELPCCNVAAQGNIAHADSAADAL